MTTTQSVPAPGPAPAAAPSVAPKSAKPQRGWFAQLLLRLHFYAGVFVGPFILVAAVSGGLYALTPTIEQVVYAETLRAPASDTQLSLGDQIRAAQQYAGDDAALTLVRPAAESGRTTRVLFADPSLDAGVSRAVFVDPATGEIRGDLPSYSSNEELPFRTWVSGLHRTLHLGEVGRIYSELAASWLGIIALAGFGLWLVRIRKSRTKKDFVRPNRKYRGYRKSLSWHTSIGAWVLLGALFLSVTGITWSQFAGGNVGVVRTALGGTTPRVDTSLDGNAPAADEHAGHGAPATAPSGEANPDTFDAMLAIGQRINVNASQVQIEPPSAPGQAWVVKEIKSNFPTEADAVAINGSTMEVVDRVDFREFSLLAKLTRWGIDLHMGVMFGFVNQLVLFLVAVGIAWLVVLGYLMWWRRRPTRTSPLEFAKPPRRGTLRGAPWWGIGLVLLGAIGIGVMLPLVGWTLVGFVVVDTVVGWVQQRRAVANAR